MIVNLPGPPREMRPMWTDQALPRLAERGVGGDTDVRTMRLFGIGESQVAELLGEPLLRAVNPIVATYARHEAVDVRVSARAGAGRTATELADEAEATVLGILGEFVWARGDATWAESLDQALAARGWTLATTETGTGGALVTLLRGMAALRRAEVLAGEAGAGADGEAPGGARAAATGRGADGEPELREAERVRDAAGADVGLAIRAGIARQRHARHRGRGHARGSPRGEAAGLPAGSPGGGPGGDQRGGRPPDRPAGRDARLTSATTGAS